MREGVAREKDCETGRLGDREIGMAKREGRHSEREKIQRKGRQSEREGS